MNEQLKILFTMLLIWTLIAAFIYFATKYFTFAFAGMIFVMLNVWLYWIVKLAREK